MNNYKIKRLSYVEFDHEPTPDELMHFKYIKREKVNGKWRYYYDIDSLKKDVKDKIGITAKENADAAKREFDDAVKREANARGSAAKVDRYREDMTQKSRLGTKARHDAYINLHNKRSKADDKYRELFDTKPTPDENQDRGNQESTTKSKKWTQEGAAELERLFEDQFDAVKQLYDTERQYYKLKNQSVPNLEKMSTSADEHIKRQTQKRIEAGEEYVKARTAYLKTPLYKIERTAENIGATIDKVIKDVKERKKRRKKST